MKENKGCEQYNIPSFLNSGIKTIITTAFIYFIIAKLSQYIFITEINILPFFPAIGFATAVTILFGRKAILGVTIGSFIFSLDLYKIDFQNAATDGEIINLFIFCTVRAIITGLNALLVTHLTLLWCKSKYPFNTKKNVLFFAFACLLGAFISVSIGFFPLAMTSFFTLDDCILIWSNMSRGNALGIILFTPLVLSWLNNTKKSNKWSASKKTEVTLLIISTLVLSSYIFETHNNNESILFFLLIWAASRFGMRVITLVALIMTTIAIYCTGHHMGGFILNGWNSSFLMLQLFLFVNMVSVLFLKAILEEKESEKRKLKVSEQALNLEKNILQATIESPKGISISTFDIDLNYLSFNSAHACYMKKEHGAEIKIGDNHIELISDCNRKNEIISIFQDVLKDNIYSVEEKDSCGEYWNIVKSPIKNGEDNIIGVITVVTNITELKLKEEQLQKNNFSLNERIKEQRCLFDFSKIISNKLLSRSEKMEACAQIIPKAMQFPEMANCRIRLQEEEFTSANYKENDCNFKQMITVNGEEWGSIEIGYFNTKKFKNENLFQEEEVKLSETLADILSRSIERKLADEKLLKSQETYSVLFENVQDVFFKTSIRTGEILDVSPSCNTFNGITREELVGQNMNIIYSDSDQMQLMFQKIITEHKVIDQNNEITIKGKLFYVSINAKIILDSNGEPEFAVGSLRDITERRLAEENLKISEEKFRSIFENMQDVYYLHDLDGRLIEISPSVEKHFHVKGEDIIGLNVKNFYNNPARYDELKAKVLEDGFLHDREVQFLTATGESVYFSVNSKLVNASNGRPTLIEGTMRNINERINNQNELLEATEKIKQSEEEFRAIFESFEDIYYRVSLDGYIQNISPSVEKILKYKREEIIDTSISNLYLNPKDRPKVIDAIIKKGSLNDFETIFKDKENNVLYVSINAHLIYDSNGHAMYIEGTIRDISQRKKNELEIEMANQTIKESEKKYRTIFDSVRDVFFRASAKDHTLLDISPSCSYFDLKPEEIIGKSVEEFYLNPSDRPEVLKELKQNGEIENYDVKFLLKNKAYTVSINSKIAFDENNEPEFLIGSFRDVSDRVKAEEKLKISESRFRSIYENFEDVYFKTDMEGKVLDVSPSFEKHFHKPCSHALGSSVFDFYYDPNDRVTLLEKLKKEGHIIDFDALFKDAHGNLLFFSVNARFLYDINGIPVNIEGTMRNINERKIMQEEMLAKNRTLEFQNTELEQFAYIASHDLQEPLITINHCIHVLQEELRENVDEDQKQYLQFINSSTARMQLLVKGLLDYSRIGKERKTSRIDCNEIVANVLADMNASLKESKAIIEYENLPAIEGYTTEVRQLFQNMISNANKYRRKDQKPKIKIAAVKEENNWLFSIQDNGIGIQEQDKDKVFVIFKRLHNRNDYQGTGIGLSHCKKIVEHHNGKIWVESKFNEGSTFKWTFPIEQH